METEVAIVGGSFAGVCLALALARRGKRPLVIERMADPPRVCRADVMQGRSMEILEELGAGEALRAGTVPLTHFRVGFEGRRGVSLDMTRITGMASPLRGVDHQLLVPALRSLAVAAGASFTTDRVTGILRSSVAIEGVQLEGGESIRARLTVGADGANSVVRQAMKVPENRRPQLGAGMAFVLQLTATPPPETTLIFGRGGRGAYMVPLPGDRARIYYGSPQPVTDPAEALAALGELLPEWRPCLEQHAERPWAVPIADLLQVGQWAADGAVLVGDAGNVVNPHAGQGMNLAIQGAARLAEAICALPARGPVTMGDLADYNRAMLRRAAVVHRMSRIGGGGRSLQHPALQAGVEWALRSLNALPWVGRPFFMVAAGYRKGV